MIVFIGGDDAAKGLRRKANISETDRLIQSYDFRPVHLGGKQQVKQAKIHR
jgi:hypothetical protein